MPNEIEAKLVKLEARIAAVESLLIQKEQAPPSRPTKLTLDMIIRACCERYGVSKMEFFSHRRRNGHLCRARQIAAYLATRFTHHTLPMIGRVMRRDHTTIIHSRDKIMAARAKSEDLDLELLELEDALRAQVAPADYDGDDDFGRSIEACYAAVRDRQANGGPGWVQKAEDKP